MEDFNYTKIIVNYLTIVLKQLIRMPMAEPTRAHVKKTLRLLASIPTPPEPAPEEEVTGSSVEIEELESKGPVLKEKRRVATDLGGKYALPRRSHSAPPATNEQDAREEKASRASPKKERDKRASRASTAHSEKDARGEEAPCASQRPEEDADGSLPTPPPEPVPEPGTPEAWQNLVARLLEATTQFDEARRRLEMLHVEAATCYVEADEDLRTKINEAWATAVTQAQQAGFKAEDRALAHAKALREAKRQKEAELWAIKEEAKKKVKAEEARVRRRQEERQERLRRIQRELEHEEARDQERVRTAWARAEMVKHETLKALHKYEAKQAQPKCFICKLDGVRNSRKCPRIREHWRYRDEY